MRARAALLGLLMWAGGVGAQADDYYAKVDLDGDGRVSLEEFLERMSFAFRQMDADANGVLEPHEQHIPNAKPLTIMQLNERFTAQFRRQDGNRDGTLSRAELLAPPQ